MTTKKDYMYAVGRRKTAKARVRFYKNTDQPEGTIIVNEKKVEEFFPAPQAKVAGEAIDLVAQKLDGYFSVKVVGGGVQSQAEAVRHGISRILLEMNPDSRSLLKSKGMLTRDPRVKERKKPGLRRARRAPQWSKR